VAKVIVVRSPESSFRPERYITDKVIDALLVRKVKFVEINSGDAFQTLSSQSLFYDDRTMTNSFFNGVLRALDVIENGDVVYFADGWSPAIPALKFHLHCSGVNAYIVGLFHSSVETPGDFLFTAGQWVRDLEQTLLGCLDVIFFATRYGEGKLCHYPHSDAAFKVTGLPIIRPEDTCNGFNQVPKEWQRWTDAGNPRVIGFSHRWAADKRPHDFIELAQKFKGDESHTFRVLHPVPLPMDATMELALEAGIEFVECHNKLTYWNEVQKLHFIFSSAELETFGYSVIEAVTLGAVPIVPDRACYPFLYRGQFIYDDLNDAENMIRRNRSFTTLQDALLPDAYDAINRFGDNVIDAFLELM